MAWDIPMTLGSEHDLRALDPKGTADRAVKICCDLFDQSEDKLHPHAKWMEQTSYLAVEQRAHIGSGP